jgi:hypothetical protein
MTSEEWEIVTRAVALQLAEDQIFGTDRTLPVKIRAILAAKDAELKRIVPSATEAEIPIDGKRLGEAIKRLVEEKALLTIGLYFAQRNYEMRKDKPKPYIALRGLLTLSRTFRATLRARWLVVQLRIVGKGADFSATERARAVELIQTADLSVPLAKEQ